MLCMVQEKLYRATLITSSNKRTFKKASSSFGYPSLKVYWNIEFFSVLSSIFFQYSSYLYSKVFFCR